jgi:DNA polymerase-3 subunit delta'
MFKEELAQSQAIVEKVLSHAILTKHMAHAYLFSGPKGAKMMETAKWFIKSQVCEKASPYPCDQCDSCRRVDEESYVDLIVLDGMTKSIKKEEVLNLQAEMSKTALETKGKKFYILNGADNASTEALNSLLKFLEEPSGFDTTAILITERMDRMLETIVSRCQVVVFRMQNRKHLIESIEHGTHDPYELNLLSYLVNDQDELTSMLQDQETKHNIALFGSFIDEYSRSQILGELFLQTHVLKKKDSPNLERARLTLFLNIGMMFFKDVLFKNEPESSLWKDRMEHLPPSLDQLKAFTLFNDSVHKISTNANLALIIDALIYQLKETSHA